MNTHPTAYEKRISDYEQKQGEVLRVFQLLATERMIEKRGTQRYRNLTIAMREQTERLHFLHLIYFEPVADDRAFSNN